MAYLIKKYELERYVQIIELSFKDIKNAANLLNKVILELQRDPERLCNLHQIPPNRRNALHFKSDKNGDSYIAIK